ncbi:MAG: hypothetical protein WAN92_00075 [Herbaspirillum sp.]
MSSDLEELAVFLEAQVFSDGGNSRFLIGTFVKSSIDIAAIGEINQGRSVKADSSQRVFGLYSYVNNYYSSLHSETPCHWTRGCFFCLRVRGNADFKMSPHRLERCGNSVNASGVAQIGETIHLLRGGVQASR